METKETTMEKSMEPTTQMQQEPRAARILHATFRPLLHAMTEILSISTVCVGAMVGLSVVIFIAISLTGWAMQTAGIPAGSAHELVLTLGIGGGAVWGFISETQRFGKTIREWTAHIHQQIEAVGQ